jgi:hypothetical protein
LVPSIRLSNDYDTSNTVGFLDSAGNPAELNPDPLAYAGGRLVSQLATCPTLGDGTPVFTAAICPTSRNGDGTAGVVIRADEVGPLGIDDPVTLDTTRAKSRSDDTSLDFFGEVELTKRWAPNFQSALRYRRDQGAAGGLGGAVIRDTVNFSNVWDIADRWQFFARADWSLRQSVQDATQVFQQAGGVTISGIPAAAGAVALVTPRGGDNNEIDTMRWGVAARLTHRFTRKTDIWTQLTYNDQDSNGNTLGAGSDFQNFLAVVGVRHVFEPIKLW